MKAKLNLTIDESLIPLSKEFARTRGLSVSQLVENLLRNATSIDGPSFSKRWRGKLTSADRSDARYEQLSKRYLA